MHIAPLLTALVLKNTKNWLLPKLQELILHKLRMRWSATTGPLLLPRYDTDLASDCAAKCIHDRLGG